MQHQRVSWKSGLLVSLERCKFEGRKDTECNCNHRAIPILAHWSGLTVQKISASKEKAEAQNIAGQNVNDIRTLETSLGRGFEDKLLCNPAFPHIAIENLLEEGNYIQSLC